MNLSPEEIDILFDASEDYTSLSDAKWECGRQKADVSESEMIRQGQNAVHHLLQLGLISLYREFSKSDFVETNYFEVKEVLNNVDYWDPEPDEDKISAYFVATEEGLRVIREDEQVKAYYRSEAFYARYPDSEWHPMKRR